MMQGFLRTQVSRRAPFIVRIPQASQAGRWLSASCRPESGSGNDDNTTNDSFRIFDMPYSFNVDEKNLREIYREHMKKLHPDKHSQKSSSIQVDLERQAAAVTNAYDTLKRPHVRATHLLELLGHPMEESATGELVGPDFLMDIMEIRQDIENITDDKALRPLYESNKTRIDETCHQLTAAFEAKDMDKALQLTAQLQYWNRIHETLREKMDSME